ncbi:MAG: nucleotidyltransferase domain-containing protein [Planctomycetes bacterium]|nr:nucleotidyltransferase domain-containing protein [Planctomycetota bacterium]
MAMNTLRDTVRECRQLLARAYGDAFDGLLLYGSSARGEDRDESDIDLLVLLKRPFDVWREIGRIVDVLYPVQLKTDRLISAKPVRSDAYRAGALEFYRNVESEAVPV